MDIAMNAELLFAFVSGLIAGAGIVYMLLKDSGNESEAIKKLEAEHEKYREGVDEHFLKTAGLFKGLTEQYRDVYQHLAEGADQLCTDEAKTLQSDLEETGLLGKVEAAKKQQLAEESPAKSAAITEVDGQVELEEEPDVEEESKQAEGTKGAIDDYPLASEVELPAEMVQTKESK